MEIKNTVDKTSVKGSEIFIYKIEVSFSSMSSSTLDGKVKTFIPSNIKYSLPPITGKLKSIDVLEESEGDFITFNFGTVSDGEAATLNMSCNYDIGRRNNDTFNCVASLYQDDIKVLESEAGEVTLTLEDGFILTKSIQDNHHPKNGEPFTFLLCLENIEDYGFQVNNIKITDVLPEGLRFDETFTPVGHDGSRIYTDTHLDDHTGEINGDTLTFDIDYFNGERYYIKFKAIINDNIESGTVITNKASWTESGKARNSTSASVTGFRPIIGGMFVKNHPRNANIGDNITYTITFINDGTETLNNLYIEDNIPDDFDLTNIKVEINTAATEAYSLYIKTNLKTEYYTLFDNITNDSPIIKTNDILEDGEHLTAVKLTTGEYSTRNETAYLYLKGTIKETAINKETIVNTAQIHCEADLGNFDREFVATTYINNTPTLYLDTSILEKQDVYYQAKEFYLKMTSIAISGVTNNPVYTILVPKDLVYLPGNEYYIYNDNFNNLTYDSRDTTLEFQTPEIEVEENYRGTEDKLIRFKFNNLNIDMDDELNVYLTLAPSIVSSNRFTIKSYLGNPSSDSFRLGSSFKDIYDYDDDTYKNEYIVEGRVVEGVILYVKDFSVEKLVKGPQDKIFSDKGNTTKNGDVDYQLIVTNNQDAKLKNIEMVDILPHFGDKGVILTDEDRDSAFTVQLKQKPESYILNILTNEITYIDNMLYEYSSSSDPIRFDSSGNTTGEGTWNINNPEDYSLIKSIKINTPDNLYLNSYEKIITTLSCKTINSDTSNKAYNSFAVKSEVVSNDPTLTLLPTEPAKVEVEIQSSPYGSISSYVWNDTNKDGIFDDNETGLNDMSVELYDENMTLIDQTTTDNLLDKPGYYKFNNILKGNYYIKFIEKDNYKLTTQVLDNNLGSKPNPETGITELIEIKYKENKTNINAGFITVGNPTIIANDKLIEIYTTYDPNEDVEAYDYLNNDITDKIVAVTNEVNTNEIGDYKVSYEVTDDYGNKSTKDITVTVFKYDKKDNSITNLINSVAKQEKSLSLLIESEALKIDKALKLCNDDIEILKINKSVENLIKEISKLEVILQTKLKTVYKCNKKSV